MRFFRVFRVFRVSGFYGFWGLGFTVSGFQGFRVSGFQGFRVSGFRVSGFAESWSPESIWELQGAPETEVR